VDGTPVGAAVASTGAFSALDVNGMTYPTNDGTAGQIMKTDGLGTLSFANLGTMANQEANSVAITGGAIDGATIGATTAASGAFTTLSSGGQATLSGLDYPTADGTSGQVLSTDGAGALSWTNNAGGLGAVVDDPSPELGGDLDVNGHSIVSAANVFDVTLTDNCALSVTNPPATGKSGSVTLILRQDGTGSRTVTWPAGSQWAGGTAPTLSTAASSVDVITMFTLDGGAVWFAFAAGLAMA
jgi:hypothetical protein